MKEDMLELIIDLYSNPKTTEYAWELIRVFGNFLSKLESLEREKTELNIQMFKHKEKIAENKRVIRDLKSKNDISEQILSNLKYPDTF